MAIYTIEVTRKEFRYTSFEVEAKSESEAKSKCSSLAHDFDFNTVSCNDVDYEFFVSNVFGEDVDNLFNELGECDGVLVNGGYFSVTIEGDDLILTSDCSKYCFKREEVKILKLLDNAIEISVNDCIYSLVLLQSRKVNLRS